MTDSEAAGLCGIALTALSLLPDKMLSYRVEAAASHLIHEIAILRNRTPEDVQREFEK